METNRHAYGKGVGNWIELNFINLTIDEVGLYPRIPHKEELAALRNALDKKESKVVLLNLYMN